MYEALTWNTWYETQWTQHTKRSQSFDIETLDLKGRQNRTYDTEMKKEKNVNALLKKASHVPSHLLIKKAVGLVDKNIDKLSCNCWAFSGKSKGNLVDF